LSGKEKKIAILIDDGKSFMFLVIAVDNKEQF